jgi:hypothetical protein
MIIHYRASSESGVPQAASRSACTKKNTANRVPVPTYAWRTVYNRFVPNFCRLGSKCYVYENKHMSGINSWTATHINNQRRAARYVDALMVRITRHAKHWTSSSISRVEVVGPEPRRSTKLGVSTVGIIKINHLM